MPSNRRKPSRAALLLVFAGVWLVAIAGGMGVLYAHQGASGKPADAPRNWPSESRVARDPLRPTLVMLAHPRCPCTRASIDELAMLMSRLGGRLTARVVFIKPASAGAEWESSSLVAAAARIPGVSVIIDEGGREAARFGSRTSGQVLLYGIGGELEFAGGITPARAHMGDNAGFERVVSLVTRSGSDQRTSKVFGCALFDEEEP
jgi:hypothetical protein